MSKIKQFPELQAFFQDLYDAGFEETYTTIYNVFDGDETPENSELDWREAAKVFTKVANKHNEEVVEVEGGSEGGGEYCYGVIRVGDKYFKAEWSYYSYNGCEYDYIEESIQEVVPVETTITVYQSK